MAGSQTKPRPARKRSTRKSGAKPKSSANGTNKKTAAKRSSSSNRTSQAKRKPQTKRASQSKRKPRSTRRSANQRPADYAKIAVSEWGDALRHGAAAVAPMPRLLAQRVKDSAAWHRVSSRDESLKDTLNPATTDKGGRAGDLADALLSKMGTPGKLASKTSLGSRVIERMLPDDLFEDEPEESPEATHGEPEEEAAGGEPEAADIEESRGAEGLEGEETSPTRSADDDEASDREIESADAEPEPEELAEPDEFAESEPDHAYAGAVRSYRRPPNAYTREPDEL